MANIGTYPNNAPKFLSAFRGEGRFRVNFVINLLPKRKLKNITDVWGLTCKLFQWGAPVEGRVGSVVQNITNMLEGMEPQ